MMDTDIGMLLLGAAPGFILGMALMAGLALRRPPAKATARLPESRSAAEEGRAGERRDNAAVETAPVGLYLLDGHGDVLSCNTEGARILGLSEQNPAGANFCNRVGLASGESLPPFLEFDGEDGPRYFACRTSRWQTPEGEARTSVALSDVTLLKMAELEALSNQRRFLSVADNTSDMIVTIGLDRIRRYVSPASERILGYTPDEMQGESPLTNIHPDDRAHAMEVSESLLRGAKARICRYRHLHKDGHYVWLEASFRTISDPVTGAPLEFVGSVRDISDRDPEELGDAANAARLKESIRLLEMAEQMANIGHWHVDLVGGRLFWSDQVYRIHDVGKDFDLSLERGLSFYHEEDKAMVAAAVEETIDEGTGFNFTARIVRPSGEVRHVASIGQAEVTGARETIGLFGVFEDITDTVVAEQELRESRDRAEAAMRAKTAFLANMSHEIRTPMNGVIGFADLLLEGDLNETQRDQVRLILDSGKAMLRLLNELLDLSKIDAGHMTTTSEPIDVAHIVRGSLRLFQPAALNKGLEINADIDPAIPTRILGDAMRVRQVLLNLVGNAVKFTDEGEITVRARRADGRIQVAVSDTGMGIPADQQEAIFEEFVQAESTVQARRGGTGLGLAITRRLVELMGGTIALESTPGEGSTFRFDLPLVEVAEDQMNTSPGVSAAPPASTVLQGRRVLLAEDNDINQMLVKAIAEQLGVNLTVAPDGAAAVRMVAEANGGSGAYELVLMDLQMPELDGISATRELRARGFSPEQLPIVALTANAYPDDIEACLAAGMQDHLAKPLTKDDLRARLEKWLQRQEAPAGPTNESGLPPELFEKYRERRRELAAFLGSMATEGEGRETAIRDLAASLHGIAGMAAHFGEADLGRRAAELERTLIRDPDEANRLAAVREAKDLFG